MITVWKNSKESFERFMSRFDHGVQRSRIVRLLRERRYREQKPNKRQVREAALKRDFHRTRREKMKYY